MKIIIQIDITDSIKDALFNSGFWDALLKNEFYMELDWPSERTAKVLDLLKGHSIRLHIGYMEFSSKELNNSDYYEMVSTQVVRISQTDMSVFMQLYDKQKRNNEDAYAIPRKLIASSIKLNENAIAAYVTGFGEELVTSKFLINLIKKEKLTGCGSQSIYRKDGSAHVQYRRLTAKKNIEVLVKDCSVLCEHDDLGKLAMAKRGMSYGPDGYNYLGCKTLDKKQTNTLKDISRLLLGNYATWVVSNRVRSIFKANKIRGARFSPIMIYSSTEYQKYLDMWTELIEMLIDMGASYHRRSLKDSVCLTRRCS